MQQGQEKTGVIGGLIILGVTFSFIAAFTEIPAGGADNYAHYNISRWAFRYPYLFLDHWGKPVFTLLTAPFAQLGLTAVRIFNILAGLFTAWLGYQLAVRFRLKAAWFAAVIAVFTPIYFVMMFSGMTEILFSLFLMGAIYLFFREKYLPAALTVSFLFLVRSEGLAFLGLFFIALLIKKEYKSLPFLFTGFILFSLIGWMYHYHDFWWLITRRPYVTGGPNVYGSGEWYSFFYEMPGYFGPVVPFFLLAGTLSLLVRWIKNRDKPVSESFLQVLLVAGSFWGYLLGHSLLWWQGISSAGLVRVMAGVAPLVGVISAFALDTAFRRVNLSARVPAVLLFLITLFLMGDAGYYYHRSVSGNPTTEVLHRVTRFLNQPPNRKQKLVVHNPYFAYSTGRDAWNLKEVQYGFSDTSFPGKNLPDSTLFVWDAHFSPNEGNFPLEKIMENPDFELVRIFQPVVPFQVQGGNNYQVLVFRKLSGSKSNNEKVYRNLQQKKIGKGIYYAEEFDFEQPFREEDMEKRRIEKEEAGNGFAYDLEGIEFSPAFHIPVREVKDKVVNKIRGSIEILLPHEIDSNQVYMVFSVEGPNKVYHYTAADLLNQKPEYNVWSETEFIFIIPSRLNKAAVLKLYIWNTGKNKILIDNFKAEIFWQLN